MVLFKKIRDAWIHTDKMSKVQGLAAHIHMSTQLCLLPHLSHLLVLLRFHRNPNLRRRHASRPPGDLPLVRTTTTTTSAASSPPTLLSVGHALRERRRFTEADVAAYAAVSGDRNPVHLDDAIARELGGFQRGRVVHGMLLASLFPSIIATSFVRSTLPPSFLSGIPSNSSWAWSLTA